MFVNCIRIDLARRSLPGSGLTDKQQWLFGAQGAANEDQESLHGLGPDDVGRWRNIKSKEAFNVVSETVKAVKRSFVDGDLHDRFDDTLHHSFVVLAAGTLCEKPVAVFSQLLISDHITTSPTKEIAESGEALLALEHVAGWCRLSASPRRTSASLNSASTTCSAVRAMVSAESARRNSVRAAPISARQSARTKMGTKGVPYGGIDGTPRRKFLTVCFGRGGTPANGQPTETNLGWAATNVDGGEGDGAEAPGYLSSSAECCCLSLRQGFCEEASDHILGSAVSEFNRAASSGLSDEMITQSICLVHAWYGNCLWWPA